MGAQWLEGVFLGSYRSSDSYITATENDICATPWSLRKKHQMEVVFQEEQPEKRPRFEAPTPQTLRIQHKDLAERVFIVACPQCEHNGHHGKSMQGFSHIAPCLQRLLDALMST